MNIFASVAGLRIRSLQEPSIRRRTQCRSPGSAMIVRMCQGFVRMRHTTSCCVDLLSTVQICGIDRPPSTVTTEPVM